jgi:signal transduction histidine kinase
MQSVAEESRPVARILRVLPGGGTLPDEVWERRHRGILIVLWLHAVGIAAYALVRDYSGLHSIAEGGAVATFAAAATFVRGSRSLRAALAAMGLLTSSALIVHLSGGVIEMHFHFFVVIGILTLYQEWIPFLLAIGYVLIHHGIVGTIEPDIVFNHESAIRNPWLWTAIHAGFVLAASAASVLAWRLNEDAHNRAEAYSLRLTEHALRQRQALEINDNVVQGLAVAKYALDAGDDDRARQAVDRTLASARHIVTDLLQKPGGGDLKPGPGDLIRLDPAGAAAAEPYSSE